MWVFTKRGFFSIVQDKDDENYLIVRARVKGDLEHEWPNSDIQEDVGSDYRYRTRLARPLVYEVMVDLASHIDYTNYKAAVNTVDQRRSEWYGMVWAIMADMQDDFLNRKE